jgi:hypothetical protein
MHLAHICTTYIQCHVQLQPHMRLTTKCCCRPSKHSVQQVLSPAGPFCARGRLTDLPHSLHCMLDIGPCILRGGVEGGVAPGLHRKQHLTLAHAGGSDSGSQTLHKPTHRLPFAMGLALGRCCPPQVKCSACKHTQASCSVQACGCSCKGSVMLYYSITAFGRGCRACCSLYNPPDDRTRVSLVPAFPTPLRPLRSSGGSCKMSMHACVPFCGFSRCCSRC